MSSKKLTADVPARHVAVVTCLDARLHPEKFLGLAVGNAHVIRNAGGRVSARLPHHPDQTPDGPHRAGVDPGVPHGRGAEPLGADVRERREGLGSRRVRRPRLLLRPPLLDYPQGQARFRAKRQPLAQSRGASDAREEVYNGNNLAALDELVAPLYASRASLSRPSCSGVPPSATFLI